jgi:hypothetical protein
MYCIYVFDKTKARRNHFKQLIHKILVAESTQKTVVWDVTACILVIVYQVLDSSNIRSFLPSCPNSCCFARQVFFPSLYPSKTIFHITYRVFLLSLLLPYLYSFSHSPVSIPVLPKYRWLPWLKIQHKVQNNPFILNVYTVSSASRCALTKGVGSDVHERLYRLQPV